MTFGEKIRDARKEKGFTQKQLAEKVGAKHNSVSDWENDKNKPDPDTLQLICGVLDITPNYLLKGNEDDFSPAEKLLIRKYRLLDDFGRETVDIALSRETQRMEQINQQSKIIEVSPTELRSISYYYKNASAGTGQILFDAPPSRKIEIPNSPKYDKADYAIGVNGDSMEPTYFDGDILLVEMTDNIDIGEIGIFVVNGESYVKKMGKDELISLNPNYTNILLNESAKCMGKVIDKYR